MVELTWAPCANPSCTHRLPKNAQANLCGACEKHWRRTCLPMAGFISSMDLQVIGREFLKTHRPTPAESAEVLRLLRGPRHPVGDWNDRPTPRLAPLIHGRVNVRRPHVLVGRRKPPTMVGFAKGIVHHVLGRTVIGTGTVYNDYLAGATFYDRRAVTAPKGVEIAKNTGKVTGYRLQQSDLSEIGRVIRRAALKIGIDAEGREVTEWVTTRYLRGVEAGDFHKPVVVPLWVQPTSAGGDHPFDHWIPDRADVPRQYRHKIRRASGRVGRESPEGLDMSHEEIEAIRRQPEPARNTITTTEAPSTEWLFKP